MPDLGAGLAIVDVSAEAAGRGDSIAQANRRAAGRFYQAAVAVTAVLTLVWLALLLTGWDGGAIVGGRLTGESVVRVAVGVSIITVLWGWLWYGIKRLLLRKMVGLSREEVDVLFTSRLRRPFDLQAVLKGRSERRIRIADMIGRRGRFVTVGMAGYLYIYSRIAVEPRRDFLVMGLQESLFDALVFSWVMLATYYSDGFLGRVAFGAQSRVMDGVLARANCMVIVTLWSLFKFFMVPLGYQLAALFPPATYATLFAFVWVSYLGSDALSEIVGSLWGRQKLRVWGIGEVNRKSVAGTAACFVGSLAICLALVRASGLGLPWVGLAVAVSASNTVLELASPRGTDDFTMATGNALLCWAFGRLVY